MYHAIVFIHVLSAIVAVGSNATYAVWFARGSLERDHLLFALRGIKFIDDRLANPAYGVLLITGIAQVIISGRSWHQAWIEWAVALYIILALLAFAVYTPVLKQQIRVLSQGGPDDPTFLSGERKRTAVGIALFVLALAIVALMVFRPGGF
ncbi:MAG: DUF2269 family protein [Candidatus Eremiobacteraeota bacterium]|nr:DUF2269 family protein [Candidatus Eremiobacteraeota bacterium]